MRVRLALRAHQDEAPVFPAPEQRTPAEAVAVALEMVDEVVERPSVPQPVVADRERDALERADARLAPVSLDRLANTKERGQQAARPADVPGSIESRHVSSLPRRGLGKRIDQAWQKRPVPADGGRARGRAADGRLAVRAQVGRLPRDPRERRRGARPLVAQRAAAAPLLPRARAAREAASAPLRTRRRNRDLEEG